MVIAPLLAVEPSPLTMLTAPPVCEVDAWSAMSEMSPPTAPDPDPEGKVMSPPLPLVAAPVLMVIDPVVPALDAPVYMLTDPLTPELTVPVYILTDPLTPELPASGVHMNKLPEVVAED